MATAVEFLPNAEVNEMMQQIVSQRSAKPESDSEEGSATADAAPLPPAVKKFAFLKGDQKFEVDEDAEIEMMADKQAVKLTLKQLKERAAGEIAVKNRMHSLAEEKKKVQGTFKEFARLSKNDPLGALEYIAKLANEADSEFAYEAYLGKLAEQAENIGKMTPEERKLWEREKKLSKAEQDLSQKERETNVALRKQEILERYPEIGDQDFGRMVDAVLENPALAKGIETEEQLLETTEELIAESLTQAAIKKAFVEVDPSFALDDETVFAISEQLKNNPDFDEEDLNDIVKEIVGFQEAPKEDPKLKEAQIALSKRHRAQTPKSQVPYSGASDYDILMHQLMEQKKQKNNLKGKFK